MDDADMYEELGDQDVASALADYLADNSLENAVRDIISPHLLIMQVLQMADLSSKLTLIAACCSVKSVAAWDLVIMLEAQSAATDAPAALRKVLRLGDAEAPLPDLWQAVTEAGGYQAVSANKGWAAIGRAFGAPKSVLLMSISAPRMHAASV